MEDFVRWWTGLFTEAQAAGLALADLGTDLLDDAADLPDGLSPADVVQLALDAGASALLVDLLPDDLDVPASTRRSGGCVAYLAADGSAWAACAMVIDDALVV